ncbi:MAG: DUF4177 domain-containing protein [Deltaproteobacteria bacterium]|nr:DUF4177 domain-containing protein [Deltaproteobacteria bacterium]
MLEYKVVESSTVTDEELTRVINEFVGQGWAYDGIQFAMRESSKRPAMAFVMFTRGGTEAGDSKVVSIHRRPRKKDRA